MSTSRNALEMSTEYDVVRYKLGTFHSETATVASEIPLTLYLNGSEAATLACSPGNLREFAVGFLFCNGFINTMSEVIALSIDTKRWVVEAELKTAPDPRMLSKRLYTSGCGKGVLFSNVMEMAQRPPITTTVTLTHEALINSMKLLQGSSPLHKSSGGVHTAGLSNAGAPPERFYDDIGRHNAVDKCIGERIIHGGSFQTTCLLVSGRISSEILFKARRCAIPVIASLGSVTHQTVLLGRSMELTIVGFARGSSFTIYSRPDRIS